MHVCRDEKNQIFLLPRTRCYFLFTMCRNLWQDNGCSSSPPPMASGDQAIRPSGATKNLPGVVRLSGDGSHRTQSGHKVVRVENRRSSRMCVAEGDGGGRFKQPRRRDASTLPSFTPNAGSELHNRAPLLVLLFAKVN